MSYGSAAEQLDVENYYVGKGLLLSLYHKSYWMGLTADIWPFFKWADNVTPGWWPGGGLGVAWSGPCLPFRSLWPSAEMAVLWEGAW